MKEGFLFRRFLPKHRVSAQMARRCLALCCAVTLLSLANALVLPPATSRVPKFGLARHSPPRLAAKPRPGSRPARGGGGGGGFGASPTGESKPKVAATGARSEAADLRAAAKAYARLNADSCLATDVYVRSAADEEWLKTGSVAVAEGGSLLQAAYAQRRLVIGHATKISKRCAVAVTCVLLLCHLLTTWATTVQAVDAGDAERR